MADHGVKAYLVMFSCLRVVSFVHEAKSWNNMDGCYDFDSDYHTLYTLHNNHLGIRFSKLTY